MKKNLLLIITLGLLVFAFSCSEDEEKKIPAISLSQTTVATKTGEPVEVTVTVQNIEELSKVSIVKKWEGTVNGAETTVLKENITGNSFNHTYNVVAEDADHVVTLAFIAYDKAMKVVSEKEVVLEIELSTADLLKKFDWQYLSETITPSWPNDNSLGEKRRDDVYRYNADGSYAIDFGAQLDDFDGLDRYCSWKLDETDESNVKLIRSKLNWLSADVATMDTVVITKINENELWYTWHADLEWLGGTNDETVLSKFASRPKGTNFVPYRGLAENQIPTWGTCNTIE